MASRSAEAWARSPGVPDSHFVSGLVYTDDGVLADEKRELFGRLWQLACHDSELPRSFDFRTVELAGVPLILVRGADRRIRTFLNVCSHRGARLVEEPSGNAERFTCFYHLWTYDTAGACIDIPRAAGYETAGLRQEDCGLREVRTALKHGLVFVNLDDEAEPLDDFLGGALGGLDVVLGSGELEVFHYSRALIDANWKAWQETNLDLYHEFMHVVLRKTQLGAGKMEDREIHVYPNTHIGVGGLKADYAKYEGWQDRGSAKTLPGLTPEDFRFVNLFPNTLLLTRGTVMRIDTVTPIGPGQALVEWRGLGLKGDSADDRLMRMNHHNQYWGPFGRNVPEDLFAAEACAKSFAGGHARHQIIAREENMHGQDDGMLRAWYAEWGRRLGRTPSDPLGRRP